MPLSLPKSNFRQTLWAKKEIKCENLWGLALELNMLTETANQCNFNSKQMKNWVDPIQQHATHIYTHPTPNE